MEQKLKRNPICYGIARNCTDFYILANHKINVNGAENIPKTGTALIIPKHQSIKDILLEGYVLKKYLNRSGNWIMKSSLPKCFELIGGIRVTRLKEVKKIKDKNNRREFLKKAKQTNQKATEYLKWLYNAEELIVMHVEGTRNYGAMNPINMSLINHTKKIKDESGIDVPLILMGIEYESMKKFRSPINVNIKQIDWNKDNLEQTISNELAGLSNL